jgi:hypothetical protein
MIALEGGIGCRPGERGSDASLADELPDRCRGALIEAAEFFLLLGVPPIGALDRLAEAGRAKQRFQAAAPQGRPRIRAVALADVSGPVSRWLDGDACHTSRIALRAAIVVRDLPQ